VTAEMVRTVRGDVLASDLGVTYVHEHLIIDSPTVAARWPEILLVDSRSAIEEVERCVSVGVGTMIDTMPMAAGRGPARLFEISEATGLHIVMTTGLHTEKYYEQLPWVEAANSDQLAAWFVADIEEGVDAQDHLGGELNRTGHKAGIIKVATSSAELTSRAEHLFEAAAIAAHETGVPILTHCEAGVGAMEQVEFMMRIGFPLSRLVVSHTDKVPDSGYHTALLESGVNLEFDQALRQREGARTGTALLLATQVERGFANQLMLGTDGARRSLWTVHGGEPGLAWMAAQYRSILDEVGVGSDLQHLMFVANPARLLAMVR
jgi:predicted metal-dependent phosphotriesterase family hydrolase